MKTTIKINEEKIVSVFLDKIENLRSILQKEKLSYTNLLLVTHPILWKLYKEKFKNVTKKVILLPEGEKTKSMKYLLFLYNEFLKNEIDRKSIVLAFGGGVIGDIVGFAAGTFMRGISYIQIPTTLLAMVDSSLGGKTAVNLKEGKNLVGIFYQPRLTLCDFDILVTLKEREILNGFGEIFKYAVLNKKVYDMLMNYEKQKILDVPFKENPYVKKLILECIITKLNIVKQDEKETRQIREKLNLGHTIAHSIETTTQYRKYTHGAAVIIGLVVESFLAHYINILNKKELDKLLFLIEKYIDFNIFKDFLGIDNFLLVDKIKFDKKTYQHKIFRFALPFEIGKVEVVEGVKKEDIFKALEISKQWMRTKLN